MLATELCAMAPVSGTAIVSNIKTPNWALASSRVKVVTQTKEEKQREVALTDLFAHLFVKPLQTDPLTQTCRSCMTTVWRTQKYFQFFTSLKKDVPAVLTGKLVYKLE